MNLAELRKKAQQEKKDDVGIPASAQALCSEEDVLAEVQAEFSALYPYDGDAMLSHPGEELEVDPTGTPPELAEEPLTAPDAVVQSQAVFVRQEAPGIFDPLALLVAGREAANADEATLADAAAAAETSADEIQELLCFRVSTELYAINIMDIKEIIKPREVTEVPRVPVFVSGVISLRGIIIPIFNMRLRLGLPEVERSAKERIIVLKSNEDYFGILVDEVIQVVKIDAASIEKPPAVLDGIDRDFVIGIGRYSGQMLIVLNLEKILDLSLG